MSTDKLVAKLVVYDAPNLSLGRRRQISNWLRQQSRAIENKNFDSAFKYTARFLANE